jgi:MFS family permease
MVRDVYQGDAQLLGFVFMTFPIGTILGSLALRARGRIERKGRAQLMALAAGAVTLAGVSLGLPFPLTVGLLMLWGVAASVFMAAGRTIFQENAPDTHRGRVLSVYTLAFMGASGAIGAPLAGLLHATLGPLGACGVAGVAMLLVVGVTAVATDVRKLE